MRSITVLIVLVSLSAFACQQYSTALQEGATAPDQTVVVSALRTISKAQQTYSLSNDGEYGSFAQLVDGGYLDERFASTNPVIKSYVLNMKVIPKSSSSSGSYSCNADPSPGETAGPHYYLDSTSADIHVNSNQPATSSDETI